jgi:hypothetical protein
MSALSKDEAGFFVRAKQFGRIPREEIDALLRPERDEQVYQASTKEGARTAAPVPDGDTVSAKPGDTFTVGPRITKAATSLPEQLRKEADALQRAGFGSIGAPVHEPWGWSVHLKGFTLPGGARTDAMVVLPNSYPVLSPIGFYLRAGATAGNLDKGHLFATQSYHGAPNLSENGWQWFCGIVEGWKPGRHTLVTYLSIVANWLNDREHD